MKKALFVAVLFLGICSVNTTVAQTQYDADNLSITISNETTRTQLWELRQNLLEIGVDFKYSPEFNETRMLTAIKVDVITPDGATASFQTSLLSENQKVEIIRYIDENGEVNFCVGNNCSENAD